MNNLFRALNDKTRRDILVLLKDKDMSAGDIADQFQISKPSISHHLDILKTAGLVDIEKKGQFIIYSINTTVMEDLLQWLITFKPATNEQQSKKELPLILIILVPAIYLIYLWNSLPDRVPIHWNMQGQINGWGSKQGLILASMLPPVLIYTLMLIIPLIDPKKKLKSTDNKFYQLKFWMVLLMSILGLFILYSAKNQSLQNPNLPMGLMGLLFAVLGNYFPSIKPNYFIGIRTAWTLESETVWKKTHQLAGKLWFAGGLLMIILALTMTDHETFRTFYLTILGILVIVPIIYSIIIGRIEERDKLKQH